jgi:UTP--glucose-1-phosphate uridylyltransferase
MGLVKTAIIPAGGLGARMLPATKAMPKEMLPIVGRPAVDYVVSEARNAGIEKILFVLGRDKVSIEDYFDNSFELNYTLEQRGWVDALNDIRRGQPPRGMIAFVRQGETFGLGDAILAAERFVSEDAFAVLLPDMIIAPDSVHNNCLRGCIDAFQRNGVDCVSLQEVELSETRKYGVAICSDFDGNLCMINDIKEKPIEPIGSRWILSGRYVFRRSIFDKLRLVSQGADLEYQLTDALMQVCKLNSLQGYSYPGRTYDVGSMLGYVLATIDFACKHNEIGDAIRKYVSVGSVGQKL